MLFFAWTSLLLEFAYNLFYNEKANFLLFVFLEFRLTVSCKCGQIVVFHDFEKDLDLISISFSNPVKLSVRFSYLVFNEHSFQTNCCLFVVGSSGVEPPTSCLSGMRSNLLSYEPIWTYLHGPWKSNNKHKTESASSDLFLCELWKLCFKLSCSP